MQQKVKKTVQLTTAAKNALQVKHRKAFMVLNVKRKSHHKRTCFLNGGPTCKHCCQSLIRINAAESDKTCHYPMIVKNVLQLQKSIHCDEFINIKMSCHERTCFWNVGPIENFIAKVWLRSMQQKATKYDTWLQKGFTILAPQNVPQW